MDEHSIMERIALDRETPSLIIDEVQFPSNFLQELTRKSDYITKGDEGSIYKIKDMHSIASFLPENAQEPMCLKVYHDYHWYREFYYVHLWNPTSGCAEILRIGAENTFSTTYVERPLIFWQHILRAIATIIFPDKMPTYYASFIGPMPDILSSKTPFHLLPYASSIMITEYVQPNPQIAQLLDDMRLNLYSKPSGSEGVKIREAFDQHIREIVGTKVKEDDRLFKAIGLNFGHWQANTTGDKYYEIWPLIDYYKFYEGISLKKIADIKRFTSSEQQFLYDCLKKLLLYNTLVIFERKRLKYELFNEDSKSLTSPRLDALVNQMWDDQKEQQFKGKSTIYFYKHLKEHATELAHAIYDKKNDTCSQAKNIFRELILKNITESKTIYPSLQNYFRILGETTFHGMELSISRHDYTKLQHAIEKKINSLFGESISPYDQKTFADNLQMIMKLDYV